MNDKLVAQVKALNDTAQDVLTKVASVSEKLDAKIGLDDVRERSTQKGAPFEDVVQIELEAIAGQLGDEVRCVKHDYGSANTQAGDIVVVVNPAHTRGRQVQFAIEVKTGKLTGPKAQAVLKDAIENRDAPAGILVFDDVADAPLAAVSLAPIRAASSSSSSTPMTSTPSPSRSATTRRGRSQLPPSTATRASTRSG